MICTLATAQTGVGTVPVLTETVTNPLASDVAEAGEYVTPPGILTGSRLKSTSTPATPLLMLSTTWNFTRELCGNVDPKIPMLAGTADINWILFAAGMATVIVALAVAPVTDAVIKSVEVAQPLSLYVERAMPVLGLLVRGVVSVALPLATQGEVNATEIGTVVSTGGAPRYTGTLTLLVP